MLVAKVSAPAKSASLPGKPRTTPAPQSITPRTQPNSPQTKGQSSKSSVGNTPLSTATVSSTTNDIAGLHLGDQAEDEAEKEKYKEQPGLSMKQEELLAKVRKDEEESDKKNISLIVVGAY
jgi:elongation factor 1 alpha-like protein